MLLRRPRRKAQESDKENILPEARINLSDAKAVSGRFPERAAYRIILLVLFLGGFAHSAQVRVTDLAANSLANGINDRGQVVGVTYAGYVYHAVLWDNGIATVL